MASFAQLNVRIAPRLMIRSRAAAKRQGIPLQQWVSDAMTAALDRQTPQRPAGTDQKESKT